MPTLHMDLGRDSYPIYIGDGILNTPVPYIMSHFSGEKIVIVSDGTVFPLYGKTFFSCLSEEFQCSHIVLPPGERTKNYANVSLLYEFMLSQHISRSDLVISLGGGVVGDLAGFAAATFLRGVSFIQVPTTLLSQVDASIGGKVGVDLPQGKNLAGTFYQPRLVLIDPSVLYSLPPRHLSDGMSEIIKAGCIRNQSLFTKIEAAASLTELMPRLPEVILEAIKIKKELVEKDIFDTGDRMLLNFGHTIAHALEQYTHYEKFTHGEAVGIGMCSITELSEKKGLTLPGSTHRLKETLKNYHIPDHQTDIPISSLISGIAFDKKTLNGQLNLVLLKQIGESFIYKTEPDMFFS